MMTRREFERAYDRTMLGVQIRMVVAGFVGLVYSLVLMF